MPPHGLGMAGGTHSHDPEFPGDDWNLYAMLDREGTTALNATRPDHAIGIFKPFVHRTNPSPNLISDADHELLIIARFTSPCHIRKLMVIGGSDDEHHPSSLQCYLNHEQIDFTNIADFRPAQQFNLPINRDGTVEFTTVLSAFTNVNTIAFYFPSNHGDRDQTIIQYIGMQGEHTHYRREAVDTTYEVLCNGQDICQPEGQLGAAHHMH